MARLTALRSGKRSLKFHFGTDLLFEIPGRSALAEDPRLTLRGAWSFLLCRHLCLR